MDRNTLNTLYESDKDIYITSDGGVDNNMKVHIIQTPMECWWG
jgi:hypothetical protein